MLTFLELNEKVKSDNLKINAAEAMLYFGIEPSELLYEAVEIAIANAKDTNAHRMLLEFQIQEQQPGGIMGGIGRAARSVWDFAKGMGGNFKQGWQSKDQGPDALYNIYNQLRQIQQTIDNAGLSQYLKQPLERLMRQIADLHNGATGQQQGQPAEQPVDAEVVPEDSPSGQPNQTGQPNQPQDPSQAVANAAAEKAKKQYRASVAARAMGGQGRVPTPKDYEHYNPGETGMQRFSEFCEASNVAILLDRASQLMVELNIEPNKFCREWISKNHPKLEKTYLEVCENEELFNEFLGGLWRGIKRMGRGLGAGAGVAGEGLWDKAKAVGGDFMRAGELGLDKITGPRAKYEEAMIALQKLMASIQKQSSTFSTPSGSLTQQLTNIIDELRDLEPYIPQKQVQRGSAASATSSMVQPGTGAGSLASFGP